MWKKEIEEKEEGIEREPPNEREMEKGKNNERQAIMWRLENFAGTREKTARKEWRIDLIILTKSPSPFLFFRYQLLIERENVVITGVDINKHKMISSIWHLYSNLAF